MLQSLQDKKWKKLYNISQFENLNVAFPETETILEGIKLDYISDEDVKILINLKRGWQNILNNNFDQIDLNYMKEINSIVAKDIALAPDELRNSPATVGNVAKQIFPPSLEVIENYLNKINSLEPIQRVIEFIPWAITNQIFWDGNKRTSFLVANSVLINNDIGILSIPENQYLDFTLSLNKFYNDKSESNKEHLQKILIENIEKVPNI